MKDRLVVSLTECKPSGVNNYLKSKYPELFMELKEVQSRLCLKSISEAIYLVLNDLEKPPECPGYTSKCIHKLGFRSVELGYTTSCNRCYCQDPIWKKKIVDTNMSRYGVTCVLKLEDVKKKGIETNLKNLGVEHPSQCSSVSEKYKATLFKHYGESGLANPEIKKKRIETCMKKHGVSHHTQLESTIVQRRATCKERYGVDNTMLIPELANQVSNSLMERSREIRKSKLKTLNFEFHSGDYKNATSICEYRCTICGNIETTTYFDITVSKYRCKTCFPRQSGNSIPEREILNLLRPYTGDNYSINHRKLIYPLELDLVFWDQKVAIEYCGLWCHSSHGNVPYKIPKDRHYEKMMLCHKKGFRLVTVFDDEWSLRREEIESKLIRIIQDDYDELDLRYGKLTESNKTIEPMCWMWGKGVRTRIPFSEELYDEKIHALIYDCGSKNDVKNTTSDLST